MPTILIAEDEPAIADTVTYALRAEGYAAEHVLLGAAVVPRVQAGGIELVVLDVGLPDMTGFDVCRALRAVSDVPVIFLTAREAEIDRVLGLELGADDYVVKPFSPRELLARIRNVLRRRQFAAGAPGAARLYRFGGWTLDAIARRLVDVEGRATDLSGSEFALLLALVSHRNQVLSRNRLIELTKGREAHAFDRSIDVCISRLRQILCDDGRASRIIKTVYGEGYVLGVPVELEG